MKLTKAILCFLLAITIIFGITGCIPGGLKFKDKDGDIEFGNAKWNSKKMFGLDKPKAELTTSITTEDGSMYFFIDMKVKDAEAYIEKIKKAGFTYNVFILDEYSYAGTNKKGETISFMYDEESESGTITSSKGEKPSEEENNEETVIGTEKKWDSSKMGGLPDPGVKVVTYWSVDGETSYTLEVLEDYMDYVDKIRECGFSNEDYVAEINDMYIFSAFNENGDKVIFSASHDMMSVTYVKAK